MSIVSISWRPSTGELRKFGVVITASLSLVGILFHCFGKRPDLATAFYIAASLLGLPALLGTRIALPGYWLWMGVAFIMGNIMGRVLLSIAFYLLVTPIGIVKRVGNDRLRLKRRKVTTYWSDIDSRGESTRYERQF